MLEVLAQFFGEVICVLLGSFVLHVLTAGRWASDKKGSQFVAGLVGGLVLLTVFSLVVGGCLLLIIHFQARAAAG